MSDKTLGQIEYARRKEAAHANKPNAAIYFNNIALTEAGEFCVGMTLDTQHNHYSCTYMGVPEERDFNDSRRWDLHGRSFDGLSDLRLDTVQVGVRRI